MSEPEFDSSPVDAWIGVPLGGGQMKDPVAPNDIRDPTSDRDPAPND